VAYHLVAACLDEPIVSDGQDAVAYALEQGLARQAVAAARPDVARIVAASFAAGEPLDHLVSKTRPLATKTVERALRRYLAHELRRIARADGNKPQDLCDVTDRTLQQWIKQDERE
jgi:hypothetical protein